MSKHKNCTYESVNGEKDNLQDNYSTVAENEIDDVQPKSDLISGFTDKKIDVKDYIDLKMDCSIEEQLQVQVETASVDSSTMKFEATDGEKRIEGKPRWVIREYDLVDDDGEN